MLKKMPNKKFHKKSQTAKGIILMLIIVTILIFGAVIFFAINTQTKKIVQQITVNNENIQNNILLLNLLAVKITLNERIITIAEAFNLMLYADKNNNHYLQNTIELRNKLNSILTNFKDYGSTDKSINKIWQLAIYEFDKVKNTQQEIPLFVLSQSPDLSHLDTPIIEAELDFPSIYETNAKKYVIKLVTLED